MFEIKFTEFNFRDFMDFVLNLADRHGLGQVRFYPEKNEFFDNIQLTHISPTRDIEDKKGFAWAWSKKQNDVRKVSFDQFSDDDTKGVSISIDLDKKTIRLNKIRGVSSVVVEELAQKRFANNTTVQSKTRQLTKDVPKDIPLFLKYLLAVVAVLGMLWPVYTYFFPVKMEITERDQIYSDGKKVTATSTILLSELLSKALTFDTVVERQDFLTKYKGEIVSGESVVAEISRAGSDFLVDFNVNRQLITCKRDGGEESEKRLLLMKGKRINFAGTFSYTNFYGHGLGLDNCSLEQI